MARARTVDAYVVLTGFADREGKQYFSYCPELGTSSCGDTAAEALESLGDAITVHLDALAETGELLPYLRQRNVRVDAGPPSDELLIRVRVGKLFTTYRRPVAIPQGA